MSSKWHRLHLSQKRLPHLLFQYTWTPQGYELHITDLTYIWSERLPHKAISKRAEEDATTIDPGEDSEQLNVLLEKIGEALQNGNENVILGSGTQTDSLEVTTTTKLPAPLKPLKWSFKLSKGPLTLLTSQLLLPLLREEAGWGSRQRSLLNQIKQKDYVLSKLFDKLETLGVDLGSVFPSAAGSRTSRKGITRLEAAKSVKGIAPFEEQIWLADVQSSYGAGLAANLLEEISDSVGSLNLHTLAQSQGEWWHQLARPEACVQQASPIEQEVRSPEESQKKKVELKNLDTGGDTTASSDDEFQRQDTPPRMKMHIEDTAPSFKQQPRRKSSAPVLPSEADETTASDTDSESEPAPCHRHEPSASISPPPPSSSPVQARDAPKRPKGGLGIIGGKKKQTEEPSSVPETLQPAQAQEAPTKPKGELGRMRSQVEMATEPQFQSSPSLSTSPAQGREALKRSKRGLGMIGGKKKQAKERSPVAEASVPAHNDFSKSQESPKSTEDLETERLTNDSAPPAPSTPVKTKRPGKLGMIGGKTKTKAPNPPQDSVPMPTTDKVAMSQEKISSTKPKAGQKDTIKAESPLPTPATKTAPPAEPETEEQRADRKREELKRALEAKSKTPAKKKRRF